MTWQFLPWNNVERALVTFIGSHNIKNQKFSPFRCWWVQGQVLKHTPSLRDCYYARLDHLAAFLGDIEEALHSLVGFNVAVSRLDYQSLTFRFANGLLQNYGVLCGSRRHSWLFPPDRRNRCQCFRTMYHQIPCVFVSCKLWMIEGSRGSRS